MWKLPLVCLLFPRRNEGVGRRRRGPAFTLVELLVAMTILVLIVVLFAQIIGSTTASITGSSNGMDMDQAAAIALDRIGNTIRSAVTSGSGTIVIIKNPCKIDANNASTIASDGLVMLANQRVRNRPPPSNSGNSSSDNTNIDVTSSSNIRLGAFGYCIMVPSSTTTPPATMPILSVGDGTVSFTALPGSTPYVQNQLASALSQAATDVYAQMPGVTPSSSPSMLQFAPVSPTIFRFEVCCLLSDGTIVSGSGRTLTLLPAYTSAASPNPSPLPIAAPLPRNKYFVAGEAFSSPAASFASPQFPIAVDALNSDAAPEPAGTVPDAPTPSFQHVDSHGQNVYVRAVIVGMASLDVNTLKTVSLNPAQVHALTGSAVLAKVIDGQTPLDAWDVTSTTNKVAAANRANLGPAGPNKFPASVLQNIRFCQRYYYVN